jgi:hypothetical protein
LLGETFRKLARDYLIAGLEKGVPSLFVDVKGLYRDASKMAAVGEIVEELVIDLEMEKLHDDGMSAHFAYSEANRQTQSHLQQPYYGHTISSLSTYRIPSTPSLPTHEHWTFSRKLWSIHEHYLKYTWPEHWYSSELETHRAPLNLWKKPDYWMGRIGF